MHLDADVGGPSAEQRELLYTRLELPSEAIRQLESMIVASGQREVGRAALTNVRVRFNSVKNLATRVIESHTCELVFAYELELDPDVTGYYVQVPCRRVIRTTKHGRTHVSTAHLDFLVLRKDRIELIECKQHSWLEKQRLDTGCLWEQVEGEWTYPPYADWATRHGIDFRTWVAPEPVGTYRQNLEACYSLKSEILDKRESIAASKAAALIRIRPRSVESLMEDIPGFSQRTALWMLANFLTFAPWKSTSISLPDRFLLYACRDHARQVDEALLQSILNDCAQASVSDPLLTATTTDLKKGRERLARLSQIEAGLLPSTNRMDDLAGEVRAAVQCGRSALSACLTNYSKSGNRTPRVLTEHEDAAEAAIQRYWNTGKCRRPKDLVYVFEQECELRGVKPCGRALLDKRRRSEDPLRHALATGGLRAYQANRPSSDPRTRSLSPLGYGQVLHVDSSDLDVRCAPDLMRSFPSAKAKFYIGVDGCTGCVMACAIIFGPARTDGLALLMRELVRRHGFLPRTFHVDRGSENTSAWMEEFCEGWADLRHSPTAASAWNGLVENSIKQVNDQVAHPLVGSTDLDRYGRRVDGRFKSVNNARTAFTTVVNLFQKFVYQDLPNTPGANGLTPAERREKAIAAYGSFGVPCEWNDDFLIRTSIRVRQNGSYDLKRGIRTADGWFVSNELIEALRSHKPTQVRSDCCRPDLLWVQIGNGWIKAFHSRVQSIALLTEDERLYELLSAPIKRVASRRGREEKARRRYSRQRLAEVAAPAIEHLAPTPFEALQNNQASVSDQSPVSNETLYPYEEREDF